MKTILIAIICFFCSFVCVNSVQAFDPQPTTREDIASWFQYGVSQEATHMVIVGDYFSYEDFPVYVYRGHDPREVFTQYKSEDMYSIMEVYALHLDMESQLDEPRSWHFEPAP